MCVTNRIAELLAQQKLTQKKLAQTWIERPLYPRNTTG